jgi:uncharacterized protein
VTNVAAFGAFVDIGVHQDGLVHVSQLADRFVKNPHEVVKAGDVVKVRVVDVDPQRKRIALTMRRHDAEARIPSGRGAAPSAARSSAQRPNPQKPKERTPVQGSLGSALMEALQKK